MQTSVRCSLPAVFFGKWSPWGIPWPAHVASELCWSFYEGHSPAPGERRVNRETQFLTTTIHKNKTLKITFIFSTCNLAGVSWLSLHFFSSDTLLCRVSSFCSFSPISICGCIKWEKHVVNQLLCFILRYFTLWLWQYSVCMSLSIFVI